MSGRKACGDHDDYDDYDDYGDYDDYDHDDDNHNQDHDCNNWNNRLLDHLRSSLVEIGMQYDSKEEEMIMSKLSLEPARDEMMIKAEMVEFLINCLALIVQKCAKTFTSKVLTILKFYIVDYLGYCTMGKLKKSHFSTDFHRM